MLSRADREIKGETMVRLLLLISVFIGAILSSSLHAFTPEQADQSTQAFNKTYWNATGKYFYKLDNRTGVLDFWLTAHAWETIMDAYVRTGKEEYKQQIKDVYDGFIARQGTDWTKNDFNDDIAWWVIASVRAYEVTKEIRYLNQAKAQFDWVYNTQRDTVLGGIWWKNNTHAEKNSCVVQPMIISAALLARNLNDANYRVKAESLYAWQRLTLVDPATGKVYDNIKTNGARSNYSSTYNQGTWIGSAVLLNHIVDAQKGADWTKANLCNAAGIFKESSQGDVGAFKLIGARYIIALSRLPGQQTYALWMEANAAKVWSNRRTDGIMGFDWNNLAPATGVQAQSAAGGVSLLNLLATPTTGLNLGAVFSHRRTSVRKAFGPSGDVTETGWLYSREPLTGFDMSGPDYQANQMLRTLNGRFRH
jgi:predicted alpha-1,6-mannanase (GH76 family)